MSSDKPVGWTFHADIYCAQCGDSLPSVDREGNDKSPIFSWDIDGLQFDNDGEIIFSSCGKCGEYANDWK